MRLFFSGVGLLLSWSLFLVAHLYFLQLYLYWHLYWLDIMMHIWGGILLVSSWYEIRRLAVFKSLIKQPYFHPLLFLIVVMVVWEVFKYLIVDRVSHDYELDTIIDLGSGLLGGLATFYWFSRGKVK